MIYEFKSRATGTIIMTQAIAEIMLRAIDHAPSAKGVITVAQLPDAIAALERLAHDNPPPPSEPGNVQDDGEAPKPVPIAQRAFPLIEMFKEALAAGKDVTWGV